MILEQHVMKEGGKRAKLEERDANDSRIILRHALVSSYGPGGHLWLDLRSFSRWKPLHVDSEPYGEVGGADMYRSSSAFGWTFDQVSVVKTSNEVF